MNIIGHQKILQFLQKSIVNNVLSHAYLFYGPKYIGKTKVAEYFIANLLCVKKKKPCGQCSNCQQILKRIHPDIIWISDSFSSIGLTKQGKIGIAQARQIKEFLFSSPFSGPYKVAIIEQADSLTLQAANALLKLLEEAPKKSIIILITRSFAHVPVTLRSRCQVLRFSFPLRSEIISFLKNKFSLKEKKAVEILDAALGRPGLAIGFAQEPGQLSQERKMIKEFIDFLSEDSLEYRFRLANLILNSKISPSQALDNLLKVIRDLLLLKLGLQSSDKIFSRELKKISPKYSQKELRRLISRILQTQFWLAANVNQRIAIEDLFVNK